MNPIDLRFLGSGDALGSGGRFQTCFHVNTGQLQFLIDCGASSLIAMKRFDLDPSQIDMIFLSHLHGDHFAGIPFLILDGQFRRRVTPLTIAGPPGLENRIRQAQEVFFPGLSQVQQKFRIHYWEYQDRNCLSWPAVSVIPFSVLHPSGSPSFALRIETEGKVIGYSGDTEWTQAIPEVALGADLFICEAYFFDKKAKYHLDYRTLLEYRGKLNCRRLILTHMHQEMLRHLEEISMEWAEDGKQVILE